MAPPCKIVVEKRTVAVGETQTVRVSSKLPGTKIRIVVQYPRFGAGKPNIRQTFEPTTGADGSAVQVFEVLEAASVPVPVTVEFYDPDGRILAEPRCRTSFEAAATGSAGLPGRSDRQRSTASTPGSG